MSNPELIGMFTVMGQWQYFEGDGYERSRPSVRELYFYNDGTVRHEPMEDDE